MNYFSIKSLIIFIVVVFLTKQSFLYSQESPSRITNNDSFEGMQQRDTPPGSWNNCDDNLSTADTQPGQWGVNKQASHQKTYISLITREISQPNTVETVWAKLIEPIKKDSCLNFSIDLCISSEFRADFQGTTYSFFNPCVLRVFGFNTNCSDTTEREILWESEPITHSNWKTYFVECKPKNNTYTKIGLQPYFFPKDNLKNSALLIDNIRHMPIDIVYEEGELIVPEGSTNIQWYYNNNPLIGANDRTLPPFVDGYYQVFYTDPDGCKRFTKSVFIKKPVSTFQVFPNPSQGQGSFQIYSNKKERSSYELVVYDASSRLVHKENININFGLNTKVFDFSNFAKGIYHAIIDEGDGADKLHCRFILQ